MKHERYNVKGFFVTGTDTGVGKTIIAGALIVALRTIGYKTCGMKPIETGCKAAKSRKQKAVNSKEKTLIPSDGTFLKNISNVNESIYLITPICFETPLAPLAASEIEGIMIDFEEIEKAYAELSKKHNAIIVEGIGGLLVPITGDYFVLDLAKQFNLPLVVVSRPGLGTINHTMLTVHYALREGLHVAGVIINYSQPSEGTLAERTNPDVMKKLIPVPIIGSFPYLKDLDSKTIEKAALKNLDFGIFKKYL